MVSGVIALMLQANPNLTYRDVEEILVRSSRQNAEFEFPSTGGFGSAFPSKNTWQTNQTGPFRNPDSYFSPFYTFPSEAFYYPIADPSVEPTFNFAGGGGTGFNFFAPTPMTTIANCLASTSRNPPCSPMARATLSAKVTVSTANRSATRTVWWMRVRLFTWLFTGMS